jgi:sugar lactone lactonase YvrE
MVDTNSLIRNGLLMVAGATLSVAVAASSVAAAAPLTQVASFAHQVTGVAVSKNGRVFVNFPRWETDAPVSVAEVMKDGRLRPYPDAGWNAWSNLKPLSLGDRFICVQSVTVDPQGFLWVVDPAAPGNEFIKPGGVKLVKIDLGTNKVVQVILFDQTVAPQGSYMNDVRVSPDGKYAFLTDSGQRGALIVVDVAAGKARRVLDGDPRTQPEPGVVPHVDGHELRRPDHRIPAFAADGIALDASGRYLYWQALVGRTLYRIPTRSVTSGTMSAADVGASVEKVATTNVADGLWMDEQGYLFITNPANDAVRMRTPDGTTSTVAKDARLRWPDSMAEGADGSIYVTASHIQDMAQFHEKGSTQKGPWGLFRIASPHVR